MNAKKLIPGFFLSTLVWASAGAAAAQGPGEAWRDLRVIRADKRDLQRDIRDLKRDRIDRRYDIRDLRRR